MVAYPTMFTMLLTGIWHGAGLQFMVFGLIHGVYLTANQAWRHFRQRAHNAPARQTRRPDLRLAMMIGVYLQVTFALIFFRSESMHSAFAFICRHVRPQRRRPFDELLPGRSRSPCSRWSGSCPTPSRSSARRRAPAASPPRPERPTSTLRLRRPCCRGSAGVQTLAGRW
jgi:hypothetical protein